MPTVRLDGLNVRSLRADGRRTDYRDDPSAPGGVRGLVLRVSASGARSFSIVYSIRGRNRRFTLGPCPPLKLGEARDEARTLLARVALGESPQAVRAATRAGALTIAELVAGCLAALPIQPTTRKEWTRLARVEIGPALGTHPAVGLTRDEIRRTFDRIAARSAYTGNRAFELLRRAYSWGVETDRLPGTPFVGLKKPGTERQSERVLSADELRLLLAALDAIPGQYADATLLLLLTGVRREMALGARAGEFEDLGGPEPRWTIPESRSKSGRAHVVPLSAWALAVVRRRLETGDDYLFPPARVATVRPRSMWWSSRFVRALRRAMGPTPPWHVHNLRHTLGTHLVEDLHVSHAVVSLILGHAPQGPRVTRVYARAEMLAERRAALVAWAAWLDGLRSDRAGADVLPFAR